MRERLYKAKRKDNGEWVFGSLISLAQGDFIVTTDHYNTVNIDLHELLKCNALWEHNDFVEVLPKTICEFIGLKDKSGKKIFENDIVKAKFWSDWGECYEISNGTIKWENGNYIIYISHYCMRLNLADHPEMEVVGNIFEN